MRTTPWSRADSEARDLIELASDGIFIADLEGRYVDVNDAGCRMLGYSREEILGKTIVDLIPPEDEERLRSDREQFLDGGTDVGEWRLRRRRSGRYLPVEVSAKILPDGRWLAFVSRHQRAQARRGAAPPGAGASRSRAQGRRLGYMGLEHQDGRSHLQSALGRDARVSARGDRASRGRWPSPTYILTTCLLSRRP